jgi:hypothetical protein
VFNSNQIVVSQLKAFSPGEFPHLVETRGQENFTVPSSTACALFVRETEKGADEK